MKIDNSHSVLWDWERGSTPAPPTYDTDLQTWIDAQSSTPSATNLGYLNTLVTSLKAGTNNWSKADRIWVFAQEYSTNGVKCLKSLTANTWVNSPTFTQYQGVKSNGTNSYINSNFVPATHASNMTLANSSASIYLRSLQSGNVICFGQNDGSARDNYLQVKYSGDNKTYFRFNTNVDTGYTQTTTGGAFWTLERSLGTTSNVYKNATSQFGGAVAASSGLGTKAIYLCCNNNNGTAANFSTEEISFFIIGAKMDYTELYNSITAYMTSLGKQN